MTNGDITEGLIRSIYKNGGMDPCDTGYVEAHGTGTRVGDPIEIGALQRVFGEGRTKRKPLYVGSVKSNIGHLEAAAGKS
jgi:acyl transferase domain-containing protein